MICDIYSNLHTQSNANKWDVNDCKIKVSKNLTQSKEVAKWETFELFLIDATLNKHLLTGTFLIIITRE